MKALVGAFNQEKALVGAFSVIVQPVVEPMELYTALLVIMGLTVRRRGLRLYINETNLSNAARGPLTLSLYIVRR